MDRDYLQNIRYKLQKRYRRVNAADWQSFDGALKQFWQFMKAHSVTSGILDDLEQRSKECEPDADRILNGETLLGESEAESVALSFLVVKGLCKMESEKARNLEIRIGHAYGSGTKHNEAVEMLRTYLVEPLYEFVDEQLDDQRATLGLLRKYKQRSEWFRRNQLYGMWSDDTRRGERLLAMDLYEYLHDQGLDFHIEPRSASGEIDLISDQRSDDRLLLDAKIFNPEKGKGTPYLAAAFGQIYSYCADYNESVAYLVVYKTCEDDLRLLLADENAETQFVSYNNKTVYFVVVDVFPHEKSASQRGPVRPIDVTEQDLISAANAPATLES